MLDKKAGRFFGQGRGTGGGQGGQGSRQGTGGGQGGQGGKRGTGGGQGGQGSRQGTGGGFGPGLGGNCVCPKCGAAVPHQRQVPCTSVKCPQCGSAMIRER